MTRSPPATSSRPSPTRPLTRRRRAALPSGDHEQRLAGQRRAPVASLRHADAARGRRRGPARAGDAFRAWRQVPAPARGALVKRLGELLDRAQGRPGDAGQPRGREDHLRGARRDPGDDRHLRLRGRAVPPALRPDDAVRAPRPPADGDLAPARCGRRDHRLQLPRRGLVLEHRRRPGLRRPRGLEALRAHPAHVAGLRRGPPAGDSPTSGRRPSALPGAPRRRRRRPGAGRPPRRRAAQRHRLDPDGPRRRTARRGAVRPHPARARRQQRRRRQPAAPTSTWPCAASSSPPRARPASAAPRCAG